jgi:hypothetical protein
VRRTASLLLLWAGIGCALAAFGQDGGMGTLGGTVLSASGKPVSGARVIMQTSAGASPDATITNAHGRFFFPQLPHGYYDVRASFSGKESDWKHNVEVQTGKETDVILRLSHGRKQP